MLIQIRLEFREIYCNNCKKILGRYNVKYFSEARIAEVIKSDYSSHYRDGHQLTIRRITK